MMNERAVNSPDDDMMARVCADADSPYPAPSAVVVAAHPDDEVIGAGGRIPRLKKAVFVQVTDGAPRSMQDALAAGFTVREEYARARREESLAALGLAGVRPEQRIEMDIADQEASLYMYELSCRLAEIIGGVMPDVVLTHPYEGGHPDHDAIAFAVSAACMLLAKRGVEPPALMEFTSYHLGSNGGMSVCEFLPCGRCAGMKIALSREARALKRKMLACFTSQGKTLKAFPVMIERFRYAPFYDFTLPPHPGRLFYEYFAWGIAGRSWRALAQCALTRLGIEGKL